jgi:lipoprotein-anchoring transpeptidase ErfK/SrfK
MKKFAFTAIIASFLLLSSTILHQTFTSRLPDSISPQAKVDPTAMLGEYSFTNKPAIFNNKIVVPPPAPTRAELERVVLGENDPKPPSATTDELGKKIFVDLTNQRLYAFEGKRLLYNFLVSTGKWGRTPTGTFRIWIKLRYATMSGGSQALRTYYHLTNIPYVMYFYNDEISKSRGFSLHGTYWHDNFGHPMSHGCVNMRTSEVEQIYNWAHPVTNGTTTYPTAEDPGTEITIFGTAPAD